jgi:hypothetical protein
VDRRPLDPGRERRQDALEIDRGVAAQAAHRLAHVAEQQPGQALAAVDLLAQRPVGAVERALEVERQRGQVVAEQVVQLARDPRPLGGLAALGEQLAGRGQSALARASSARGAPAPGWPRSRR